MMSSLALNPIFMRFNCIPFIYFYAASLSPNILCVSCIQYSPVFSHFNPCPFAKQGRGTSNQMEQTHLFRFTLSVWRLPKSAKLRACGVYLAGALYALGFWSMMDSAVYSHTINASSVHVTIVDWIPIICSSLGMLIVNSIEKSNLLIVSGANRLFMGGLALGDGNTTVWTARVILFFGFSLLAGGMAGSIMVFVIKFVLEKYTFPTLGMGVSNIVANASIMVSCILLWIAQNIEDEYSYNLSL